MEIKKEIIDELENDLVKNEIMDRDDMEQLWQICHQRASNPVGDYNSIIRGKWISALHETGTAFPWSNKTWGQD